MFGKASRRFQRRPYLERLEDRTLLTAGALDLTFGEGGLVTTDFGDSQNARDLAVQTDGKIVVVGTTSGGGIAVARYKIDGGLDTDFDQDGLVTRFPADPFNERWEVAAVLVQTSGKLVVVGTSTLGDFNPIFRFALWRFNSNGSFDTSTTTSFGVPRGAVAVAAAHAEGKIVVAGDGGGIALARYNADLTLDSSLDYDGLLTASVGFGTSDVAVQADGKIVVAGDAGDFGVARFNADGTLDASFDQDGVTTTDLGSDVDRVVGVAIQADGKIVVAGSRVQPDFFGRDFALVRYNANGHPDGTFGKAGIVTTDFGVGVYEDARAMTLQADGRIVVAGNTEAGPSNLLLARYNVDGTLDTDFGTGGLVQTDLGTFDHAAAVAVQPDGKILLAGGTRTFPGTDDFALLRFEGLGARDVIVNRIGEIIGNVQTLVVEGWLTDGQGNSLLAKLQVAIQKADRGQNATAVNQLEAFIDQVNDFVSDGILTPAQGQPLIDAADEGIALLA